MQEKCKHTNIGTTISKQEREVTRLAQTLPPMNTTVHLTRDKTVTLKSQCALIETKAITQTSERLTELKQVLGVDHVTLSVEQRVQLTELIANYSDVFALANSELGCTDIVCHSIDMGDSRPIKQQPYRTPIIHRETISRMIDEMEEQGSTTFY